MNKRKRNVDDHFDVTAEEAEFVMAARSRAVAAGSAFVNASCSREEDRLWQIWKKTQQELLAVSK